jgi:hypothetical protein
MALMVERPSSQVAHGAALNQIARCLRAAHSLFQHRSSSMRVAQRNRPPHIMMAIIIRGRQKMAVNVRRVDNGDINWTGKPTHPCTA